MSKQGITFFPQGLAHRDIVELAQSVEQHGYDCAFVVEAGFANDAVSTALAIATATERLRVGTGIANLYFRHPATLGAGAVAIDELADGRFVLGIGASNRDLVSSLGIPWRDPVAALSETTEWLRQVFAGEHRTGLRAPFRPARHRIPIHWAGVGMQSIAAAAAHADGLMLYLCSGARFDAIATATGRAAHDAGRDPAGLETSILLPTFMHADLAAAAQAARSFLAFYCSVPVYARMFRQSGFGPELEAFSRTWEAGDRVGAATHLSQAMLDEVCLVGPRSRCRERLAWWLEQGIDLALIAPRPVAEGARAAAQNVIAALAAC